MLIRRAATTADLGSISAIYNYYVLNSTATFAIEQETMGEREQWFSEHAQTGMPIAVMEEEGQVVAFASLSKYHGRCGYRFTAEISLYVKNEHHRRGLGAILVQEMLQAADKLGMHAVLAIICSENQGSIRLFEKFGFSQVGELKEVGEKFGRFLSVSILERLLP